MADALDSKSGVHCVCFSLRSKHLQKQQGVAYSAKTVVVGHRR